MGDLYMVKYIAMMRKFKFSIGEYYHIYNRGTDKRTIFMDEEDRQRFSNLLYLCNSEKNIVFRDIPIGEAYGNERGDTLVDIGAYCLMQNHFHLLIREKMDSGISIFMQKLLTAYSMYFNTKYKRSGSLYEGPFRATHVSEDRYLKYLFAYIHLNPVKIIDPQWKEYGISNRAVAKEHLSNYLYSSYQEYLGILRKEWKILNRPAFPEYFTDPQDFEGFVDEWLSFKSVP